MLILSKGTSHKIRLTTDASGDIEIHYSAVDKTGTGPSSYSYAGKGEPLASVTTATTTDVLAGAASTETSIRHLSFYNNHASTAVTCTVFEEDGTDTVTHAKVVLAAGEKLNLDAAAVWTHYDANMGPYVGTGPFAIQSDQEAGTSLTTVVSPGVQHYHPSACKCWGKAVGAGTSLTVNYNITSVSDTGTGRLGVNIGTDFSSANYSITTTLERSVTSLTATGVEDNQVRNASPAAGSFEIESYDQTAITFVAQDPTSYFWSCSGDQ